MTGEKFVSYAQNREDVVLWRALGAVRNGRYVEIGGNDPEHLSVTKAFYDRGWRGLVVEPVPSFADKLRRARPEDVVVEAAVMQEDGSTTLHVIEDSGLSTVVDDVSARHEANGRPVQDLEVRSVKLKTLLDEHSFDSGPVHFLVVDVEGAEHDVLAGVDFRKWRPWVVVVEATAPLTKERTHGPWEHFLLDAGYEFTLFDGLSRFYVAQEHAETLSAKLDHPANVLDDYVDLLGNDQRSSQIRSLIAETAAQLAQEEARTQEWRIKALVTWASGVAQTPDLEALRNETKQLKLALDEAENMVARQATQIKTLRRRLRKTRAAGDSQRASSSTRLRGAARALTRRGK